MPKAKKKHKKDINAKKIRNSKEVKVPGKKEKTKIQKTTKSTHNAKKGKKSEYNKKS